MSTTVKTKIPDQLWQQAQNMVEQGWADNMDDLIAESIRSYLKSHQETLGGRPVREGFELDNQHLEKLHTLGKALKKNTSELIAFAIDEVYKTEQLPTEGARVLAILQKTGYLASMPDIASLSENYKEYLDWSDKA